MSKKIIIFGATGGTGQELIIQSLAKGHQVTAYVRSPKKLQIQNRMLSVIKGDVLNYEEVHKAMNGHSIVFSCLGMPASDKTSLRTIGTANIVKAMESHKVKRFISQTSLGYGDSKEVLPWHMKYLVVPFILKNAFKDHESQEEVIQKSNTEWTIVRPGNMTNGERTGNYKFGFLPTEKIKLKISRSDVADFMLRQIENADFLYQKVGVSY